MNAAELKSAAIATLNGAVSLIRERGWAQGCTGMYSQGGPVCMVVALVYASPDGPTDMLDSPVLDEATRRLWVAGGNRMDAHPDAIWSSSARLALLGWNDEPGRTEEEVIHLLQSATAESL